MSECTFLHFRAFLIISMYGNTMFGLGVLNLCVAIQDIGQNSAVIDNLTLFVVSAQRWFFSPVLIPCRLSTVHQPHMGNNSVHQQQYLLRAALNRNLSVFHDNFRTNKKGDVCLFCFRFIIVMCAAYWLMGSKAHAWNEYRRPERVSERDRVRMKSQSAMGWNSYSHTLKNRLNLRKICSQAWALQFNISASAARN